MRMPVIFPETEGDGCEPFRKIAEHLKCDEYLVIDAFRGVALPEWETPEHLDAVKETTHAYNEATRHAANLLRSLNKLSNHDTQDLIQAGCVTIPQIEHLALTLERDYKSLDEWGRKRFRAGGRNPAAYEVAEGIRRTFRRLRLNITYGVTHDDAPSTDFTRAVKFALGAFGIKANFKRPARKAFEKHLKMGSRRFRCASRK